MEDDTLNIDAIGTGADIDLIFAGHLGECLQICFCHLLRDGFLKSRINQCHAASLEAGSAEATAIDAIGLGHYLVKTNLLWGSALPIMDAAPA